MAYMRGDDDSFLSAYMDGQLNTDQQQLVESMLVARPQFADKLRDLAAVRDLVVGMNRDARVDVANDVMERVRRRSRPRLPLSNFRPWSSRTRKLAASAGMFAAVAGLVLMVNLSTIDQRPIHRAGAEISGTIDNRITDSGAAAAADSLNNSEAATVALVSPSTVSALKFSAAGERGTQHMAASRPAASDPDRDLAGLQVDLAVSRELLDSPNRRRFFVVKNGRDGNSEQQIASIVERTTRFKFCKITVSQGIVIDPRHPDQATVFAFLVNPNEVDRVLDQLKSVLPDAIEETPADPAIVTQLADIIQVHAAIPAALADVMIPREDLALKTKAVGSIETAAHFGPALARQGSIDAAAEHPRNESLTGLAPSGSRGELELGKALVSAAVVPQGSDASGPGEAHSPQPIPATGVVRSPPDPPAIPGGPEKSKDMIVVFVWVCQPKPS
jgi:hypothetical protein